MPIKKYTTGNNAPALPPEIGTLRKGEAKQPNRPGKDLNHFRFVSKNPNDTELNAIVKELYGETPNNIVCMLPSDDLEVTCPCFLEEWAGGKLTHRCDGEVLWVYSRDYGWVATEEPCPYLTQARPVDKYGKELGCQPVMRLKVVLRDLTLEGGYFGVVTVLSGSEIDIENVRGAIEYFQSQFGSVIGVPFELFREPKRIKWTDNDGKEKSGDKWFINLRPVARFMRQQMLANEQRRLGGDVVDVPARALPALADPAIEEGERLALEKGAKALADLISAAAERDVVIAVDGFATANEARQRYATAMAALIKETTERAKLAQMDGDAPTGKSPKEWLAFLDKVNDFYEIVPN